MFLKKLFLSFAAISVLSCTSPNSPHPTPVVADTDKCSVAQLHLEELSKSQKLAGKTNDAAYCDKVLSPTREGKSYTQVCQETQTSGIFLNPKCVSTLTSCMDLDKCTSSNK